MAKVWKKLWTYWFSLFLFCKGLNYWFFYSYEKYCLKLCIFLFKFAVTSQIIQTFFRLYGITKIKKHKYKKLNIFVLFIGGLNRISKIMIFVNNNNKKMILIEYLHPKFSNNLQNKVDQVIQCFYSNLLIK